MASRNLTRVALAAITFASTAHVVACGDDTPETTPGSQSSSSTVTSSSGGGATTATTASAGGNGDGGAAMGGAGGTEAAGGAGGSGGATVEPCGNGVVEMGEQCDDGNNDGSDGCDPACNIEDGYVCDDASPSACAQTCGDGNLDANEECDDGDLTNGDGCGTTCRIEGGHCCNEAYDDCTATTPTTFADTGLALTVPGGGYTGPDLTLTCHAFDLVAPTRCSLGRVEDLELGVNLTSTFAGDITLKVFSPQGTELTVMSRPGYDEPADDGSGYTEGHPADFYGPSRLTFADDHSVSAEEAGANLDQFEDVCADDGICDYKPFSGAGAGTGFADFAGEPTKGKWWVCVGDAAGNDSFLEEAALTFTVE